MFYNHRPHGDRQHRTAIFDSKIVKGNNEGSGQIYLQKPTWIQLPLNKMQKRKNASTDREKTDGSERKKQSLKSINRALSIGID